jgi:hypothetical protein
VKQETVLAWVRLLLIVARPDLHIATVLHACSLPVVVSQVPIINFCVDFMSITIISITRDVDAWTQTSLYAEDRGLPSTDDPGA